MPYGSRLSAARLRWMAGGRMTDGRLPAMFPAIFRARLGSDEVCQVCDRLIDRYQVEYQVADARDGRELAFHLMCYKAWQLECRRLSAETPRATTQTGSTDGLTPRRSSSRPW